ncbi:MAG: four helix bundle protein [Nitrospirae bacterium]|nr:four helix bundle protein [Nitrospirota bacterium]
MGKGGFQSLKVWQKSRELAVHIYQITNEGAFNKDFGLRDQIRRAVISIASNIAEGDERETDKEAVRYFYIAKGSSAEVLTHIIIAYDVGYLQQEIFKELEQRCIDISSMLSKLISARSKTFRP